MSLSGEPYCKWHCDLAVASKALRILLSSIICQQFNWFNAVIKSFWEWYSICVKKDPNIIGLYLWYLQYLKSCCNSQASYYNFYKNHTFHKHQNCNQSKKKHLLQINCGLRWYFDSRNMLLFMVPVWIALWVLYYKVL